MQIAIIGSNSQGLKVDAAVLQDALCRQADAHGIGATVRSVALPWQVYQNDTPVRRDRLGFDDTPDVVVFLENIVAIEPPLPAGVVRILVPNPEWMSAATEGRMSQIDQVWHKTRFSLEALGEAWPDANHAHMGFTSFDLGATVQDYARFAHFRGKAPKRHSAEILSAWSRRPDYPVLRHHFYSDAADPGVFSFPQWLSWRNVEVRIGLMEADDYRRELASCGIHLCTSASEGFGHYINEARAMSAVAVVLDAAPMNELIDADSGVLIPVRSSAALRRGRQHSIAEADILASIDRILALDMDERARLGANARQRFLDQRTQFMQRVGALIDALPRSAR
jgi:hypothetical protein